MIVNRTPLEIRFWSKVEKTDTCWLWRACSTVKGYGCIYTEHGQGMAHRLSWEFANGPIRDGLFVLHRCDNPRCVNPAHLFLGTNADNMRDMVTKGLSLWGERAPNRKLTEEQVRAIRRMYASGKYKQRDLGTLFNIRQTAVSRICRGITWHQCV